MKNMLRAAIKKLNEYGKLVMFSHTIFSLSFAAVSFLTVSGKNLNFTTLFWALLAFLGARTGANALNRLADAEIDAKNPRTAQRQLPRGQIKKAEAAILAAVCFAAMVIGAAFLNPLCVYLSPAALFLMFIYSYTKRFTWLCHLVLGVTCACAPVGAWLAVTGRFAPEPLFLGAANCLWTAGFDIIYGSQDYEFDKANGLHSIPVRFGVAGGLMISALFHAAAFLCLCVFGLLAYPAMGAAYWPGLFIIAVLMVFQHAMVTPEHLDRANIASYSVSQITSLVFLASGILGLWL